MGLWKLSATTYEGQKFHPDCNDDGTYTCVLGGGWSKDLGLGQHWGHLGSSQGSYQLSFETPNTVTSIAFLTVIGCCFRLPIEIAHLTMAERNI